jgi:hypothetical protein
MVFDALAKDFTAWLSADGRNFLFAGGVLPCEVVKPELLMAPNTGSTLCMVRWEFGADADRWTFIPVGTDRTPSSFPISPIRFFASNPHLPANLASGRRPGKNFVALSSAYKAVTVRG